jgi:hypothetical protein
MGSCDDYWGRLDANPQTLTTSLASAVPDLGSVQRCSLTLVWIIKSSIVQAKCGQAMGSECKPELLPSQTSDLALRRF